MREIPPGDPRSFFKHGDEHQKKAPPHKVIDADEAWQTYVLLGPGRTVRGVWQSFQNQGIDISQERIRQIARTGRWTERIKDLMAGLTPEMKRQWDDALKARTERSQGSIRAIEAANVAAMVLSQTIISWCSRLEGQTPGDIRVLAASLQMVMDSVSKQRDTIARLSPGADRETASRLRSVDIGDKIASISDRKL